MMKTCYFCKKEIKIEHKVGFRDTCPECSRDLHICKNCRFYDEGHYNKCREPRAEWVSDREKNNYCEYFEFKEGWGSPADKAREEAIKKWKKIFGE